MNKETILTGLQPTGSLHIGNYLGAVQPMIKMQRAGHMIYMFVPDLHSLTINMDYSSIYPKTIEFLKLYVAAGLDIESDNVVVFRQSHVPANTAMGWIFTCFSGFGELSRMTQFKDKSQQHKDTHVSAGLFAYPALMAAEYCCMMQNTYQWAMTKSNT